MRHPGFLVVSGVTIGVALGPGGEAAQERVMDLPALAARLELSEPGVRRWLAQLGVTGDGPPRERLLALSPTGEVLMARDGDGSSVRVDAEMDKLLRQPDLEIVLLHNHPANVGLSSADLRQLTKRGVVAIVAVGHEGSVFIASAGPRLNREFFEERQYAPAKAEVQRRLRASWPVDHLPVASSDAHFPHLVTLVLARTGAVRYWFELRGSSRKSYERGEFFFSRVLLGAGTRLRNN